MTPSVFLPFAVDDHYAPSGFMGREDATAGTTEITGIAMTLGACPERPQGAQGDCHKVVFTPQGLDEMSGSTWAGVFWQYPESNWGSAQGLALEQGATKVVFKAWADTAGQQVEFLSGGLGTLGDDYQDTFKVQSTFTLTAAPQEFELNLAGSNYTYVLGAFGWVVSTTSTEPVTFYIDDIRWVK